MPPRDLLSSWRAATAGAYLPKGAGVPGFGAPEQAEFPPGQRSSVTPRSPA